MKYIAMFLALAFMPMAAFANYNASNDFDGNWVVKDSGGDKALVIDKDGVIRSNLEAKWLDDFWGDVLADEWAGTSGSDAQAADPAISAGVNGVVVLQAGDAATGTVALNGSQLSGELNFEASQDNLVYEVRAKQSALTSQTVFLGFTDTKSLEMPADVSGTTASYNATDAVGFVYDNRGTGAQWYTVGVANGASLTAAPTGVSATTDYKVFRVNVDSSGKAEFLIDGNTYGVRSAAVGTTATIVPVAIISSQAAASPTLSLDYIQLQQDR